MEQGFKIIPKAQVIQSKIMESLDREIGSGKLTHKTKYGFIIEIKCEDEDIAQKCKNHITSNCQGYINNNPFSNQDYYTQFIADPVDVIPTIKSVAPTPFSWNKYDSLWNEYKYRHDLIWKLMFRTIAATVAISIIPYAKKSIVGELNYPDYTGFWGGLRYPPKEAEMQRLCNQLS